MSNDREKYLAHGFEATRTVEYLMGAPMIELSDPPKD